MHLPVPYAAPEYSSSEWAAHNAAMRAKRPLLSGQHPKIGSTYCPPPFKREPAIEVYKAPIPTWMQVVGWAIALPGALVVLATLGHMGGY